MLGLFCNRGYDAAAYPGLEILLEEGLMTDNTSVLVNKRVIIVIVVAVFVLMLFLLSSSGEQVQKNKQTLPAQQSSQLDDTQSSAADKQSKPDQEMSVLRDESEKSSDGRAVKNDPVQIEPAELESTDIDQLEESSIESLQAPLTTRKSPVEGGGVIIELDDRYLHK